MARIKIDDLPDRLKVNDEDMKKVLGGYDTRSLPSWPFPSSRTPFTALPQHDTRLRWGIVDQLAITKDNF